MSAGTELDVDAAIQMLRVDLIASFDRAWARYFATGWKPPGCGQIEHPATHKHDSEMTKSLAKATMLGSLARELALCYFGKPCDSWDYEIRIVNGVGPVNSGLASLVVTKMDYCGNRSANVRDIGSGTLWTGGSV